MISVKNFMAIIVATHQNVHPAMLCYGHPIPANAISKLEIFRAGFDHETNLPVKQEKLFSCYMADSQFGAWLATPGVEPGQQVTISEMEGQAVDLSMLDNTNGELGDAISKAMSIDSDVTEQINRVIEKAKSMQDGARPSASSWRELGRSVSSLKFCASNTELQYALDKVHEKAQEHSMAWLQNFQSFLRNNSAPLALPSPQVEGERTSPFGRALITYSSGRINLFADSEYCDRSVSIIFSRDTEKRGVDARNLLRLGLSPMQFARLLRSNGEEIPCTIQRYLNQGCDPVTLDYTDHIQETFGGESSFNHDAITGPYLDKIAAIEACLMKSQTKGNLETIVVCLEELHQIYAEMKNGLKGVYAENIESIITDKQKAVTHYAKHSVKSLPPAQQREVLGLLDNLPFTND